MRGDADMEKKEYRISNKEQGISKEWKMFDLEDRLIDFAVNIIPISESLPKTRIGRHVSGQIVRCGTSRAPNYGEAQGAESRADFIHKMKKCLKELRETRAWLLIIVKAELVKPVSNLDPLIDENNQLTNRWEKRRISNIEQLISNYEVFSKFCLAV